MYLLIYYDWQYSLNSEAIGYLDKTRDMVFLTYVKIKRTLFTVIESKKLINIDVFNSQEKSTRKNITLEE